MTESTNNYNLHRSLFSIATPIIIQNLVLYLQIQVDMAMVGQADPLFLSAIANVLYPYNIVIAFLSSLSTGVTVLISHSLGAGSLKRGQRYAEVSFFFNFIFSIPFFLCLFFFASTLLTLMGTSAEIHNYGTSFLKCLSPSVLFLGVNLSVTAIMMGLGRTKHLMIAAIITTAGNIFFDWALIYGKVGFPEMGIAGAGLATSIANFFGLAYLVISLIITKSLPFKPGLKGILNPRWSIQKQAIIVGLPFGLESMLWSFGQIIMVRMVNMVDDLAAGLYVLVLRIQSVTFFFYLGMARATMILVGREVGAKNWQRAFDVVYLSLKYAIAICIIAMATFLIFPAQIMSIFSKDKDLIERALPLIKVVSITIFPVAINVVAGNALRGLKDTKWMFYTQSLGTTFVISVSAVMLFILDMDLMGIILTVLLDEFIRAFLNFRRFRWHVGIQTKTMMK